MGTVCVCVCSYVSTHAVQAQLVCQLRDPHGVGEVLLVGEHQNDGVLQLILLDLHDTPSCD